MSFSDHEVMDTWSVTGVQVDLVNLLDLQLLSDGDSPEKSDEDDGTEWRMGGTEKSIEGHPFISQLHIDVFLLLRCYQAVDSLGWSGTCMNYSWHKKGYLAKIVSGSGKNHLLQVDLFENLNRGCMMFKGIFVPPCSWGSVMSNWAKWVTDWVAGWLQVMRVFLVKRYLWKYNSS